jgi:glutathione S-transferase
MKLFYAARSPFARKPRIVLHEVGLAHGIDLVVVDPWKDETLRQNNPLCKVPTLVLDDGSALYDSCVICEYLDEHAGGTIFPKTNIDRWDALRRQALGDGLAEAVIRRYVEQFGAPSERAAAVIRRQEAAIDAAIGTLDAAPLQGERFDIGDVAMLAALAYLDFRSPEIAWRERFPRAALWLDRSSCRPSAIATAIARA